MSRMRRWVAAAVGLLVAGGLGACGVEGGNPSSGCTDDTRSAGEPGDAEPVLILGGAHGAPTIVYADGAVVIPNADVSDLSSAASGYLRLPMMAPGYMGDQPGGFHAGWLSDCELAAVIERADALLTDDVDFGAPQVTDSPTTNVTYRDDSFEIYAFSRTDPGRGGISRSQHQARQDLADLWTLVEQETELTDALEVDRLFVRFYGSVEDEEVTNWPLPTAVSDLSRQGGCVTVSEPELVEAMFDRLQDGPLLDETEFRIAVVAAAPGVADCG